MKKVIQQTYIIIGLEVLDDGSIFSSITCRRGSFNCKHGRTGEAKTKLYIFFSKTFTNKLFKSYTAIAMWCRTPAKWSHCKVTSLSLLLAINTKITGFSTCTGNISLVHRINLASFWAILDLEQYSLVESQKQLLLYYYDTYLQVAKALLSNV